MIKKTNYPFDIEWSDIPAGTFMLGTNSDEIIFNFDNEIHFKVSLSAFKMSKYAVTFEQYDAFCDETGRAKPADEGWGRGKRPVINVSWDDATAFAKWMGCRLPTEAEWEYACRAGTTTPFNTGLNLTAEDANYNGINLYSITEGENREKTMPVGTFAPNAWGLYDMHGNVWEWCSDWYGEYPNVAQSNPIGPPTGFNRVIRGGSWYGNSSYCTSAYRANCLPYYFDDRIGFRLVSSK